jgi:hypothetical protein
MTYGNDQFFEPAHRRRWSTSNFGQLRILIPAIVAIASISIAAVVYPVSAAASAESLWDDTATPRVASHSDPRPVEVGMKFSANVSGTVTGIKFYKGTSNNGAHRGNLWKLDGTLLATTEFKNETPNGWQQAMLDRPVALSARTTYVVSYHTTSGYAADTEYFTKRRLSGHLRAPASTAYSPNGVYRYGDGGFPNQSYRSTNYWVDVIFRPGGSGGGDPVPTPSTSTSASAGPSASPTASGSPTPTGAPPPGGNCPPGSIGAQPNCIAPPPFAAPGGKQWRVSFSEEFNNGTYDKSKLTPCFDWNYGACTASFNQGREHYLPEQVVVSNGTAKLIAGPMSPPRSSNGCQGGSCTYKAGLLSTARARADRGDYLYKFTYGYVESRFKFPATRGFFTAFWMLPADPSYNYRSEIDILEMLGDDPTTMFMTYHYNNRGSSYNVNRGKFNNGACAVKNYSTNFVRMGLDWQPNRIAWYIDGVKCAEFTNASQIENGPMQLILHMMVDNNWQRSWNVGLADPTLVRQLEVDYIRVYQHS